MELHVRTAGEDAGRPPVLLIHGGAEDADLLDAQAKMIAETGRRVIWYDRRGTGASTRADWPGGGADQHADDAADLLRRLDATPAVALGFSSGGIVALAMAARHPEVVAQAVVWEAPVVTVLPDGLAVQEQLMAATEEHLRTHPNDWAGAFRLLMAAVSDGRADLNAPSVVHMMRNAEAFIVDDGRLIVRRAFHPGEVPADLVTIALGEQADPLHVAISEALAALIGCPLETVPGAEEHEVYVNRPQVLARWLNERV